MTITAKRLAEKLNPPPTYTFNIDKINTTDTEFKQTLPIDWQAVRDMLIEEFTRPSIARQLFDPAYSPNSKKKSKKNK